MTTKPRLITILGPTASGKTTMAVRFAQRYNAEIVCADSRTVYRGMDIGTAKPSKADQQQVRHHLLDICDPNRAFSSAEFKVLAEEAIQDIQSRDKLALLVGGSGMYIDSILFDYKFRSDLSTVSTEELHHKSILELQTIAQKKYPKEYIDIDIKNKRRLIQLISKGPSKDDDRKNKKIGSLVIGIGQNKAVIKQNIEIRTKNILNQNFVQEVEYLRSRFGETAVLKQTTGYCQVLDYLNGGIKNMDDLYQAIVNATWQLSRKQMTWFKRNKNITWIDNDIEAERLIQQYL
ncbi:MAG: tRNA dimethylallyltransferase [Patescibacteria group bacterium]|jgi:tRNA dimethylallyltransferase|nr:tRNA dimethylallyltransferase [Patescibacteria group bacterium]